MTTDSKIEWTDHTFNPWWGCVKVSPGCKNCYAEGITERFRPDENIWGPASTTDRSPMSDDYWRKPHAWNRKAEAAGQPAFVFCASMADVFEDHPQIAPWRERLWGVIEATPWLTWQLLTKRPENVLAMTPWGDDEWPPNVWVGTSVEDQQRADERVPALLGIPARVRFLSVEPLIGTVRLESWTEARWRCSGCRLFFHCEHRETCPNCDRVGYWTGSLPRIGWVIVGGESGPNARPMHPIWVRSLRAQCAVADVPFFFKQWGAWAPSLGRSPGQILMWPDGSRRPDTGPPWTPEGWTNLERVGKKDAGRTLDGRTHNDRPPAHVPTAAAQGSLL